MIYGGAHLQWPPYGEIGTRRPKIEKEMDMEDYFQQYHGGDGYDNAYDDIREKEVMDMEQAFDEAMWEWILEQGPPQDGDIVWLKAQGYVEGLTMVQQIIKASSLADKRALYLASTERLAAL